MIWIAWGVLAAAFAMKAVVDARAEFVRRMMIGSLLLRQAELEAALFVHGQSMNELCAVLESHFRDKADAARLEQARERLKAAVPDLPPDETKH